MTLNNKAAAFAALHRAGAPLVLANAWDVTSARIVAAAGAPAVATTSAGVAWSLGYPDGDAVDLDLAIGVIARITAAVDVPVTADIESGYGTDAAGVGRTVARVLEAGAVGINLEDAQQGGSPPPAPQRKPRASTSTSTRAPMSSCARSANPRGVSRPASSGRLPISRPAQAGFSCLASPIRRRSPSWSVASRPP
jgi:hypothetical protein